MNAPLDIDCPTCNVAAHMPCRTRTTGRTTDTHSARYDAWWARDAERRASLVPHLLIVDEAGSIAEYLDARAAREG